MSAVVVDKVETEEVEESNNKKLFQRIFHKKSRSPHASQHVEYRMIGDYILGETLGMGGYSKVKLGIHKDTRQKVALKIMFGDENGVISESKKKQLKRELNVMKKVKHGNVIQLIEFHEDIEYPEANGTKQSCLVTILEFAPGGELFDFLMFTGRFSDEATRTYCRQFLDGLEAIHQLNIAHRDLKPENLLMDADFNLKIADFGFATEYKTDTGSQIMMNTACGTKGYLAPELLKGKKYTEKCDLFAVGIIVFTTYAGFPPFQNAVDTDWWWDKLSKAWAYFETAKTKEDESEKSALQLKSKEKFDLFWKAHERSLQFGDEFKDVSLRILHPKPEIRYGISDIREHKWYKGKMLDQKELKSYMDKRIRTVMKERAQKIKQQLNDQKAKSKDKYDTRGDVKTAVETRVQEMDPDNLFNQDLDYFKDDTFISTYYQFLTKTSPNEVAVRIERIATQQLLKVSFAPSQHLMLIRASVTINQAEDDVIIAVKQFLFDGTNNKETDANNNDDTKQPDNDVDINNNNNVTNNAKTRYIVAFKRLKGESLNYRHVVEQFYNHENIVEIMDTEDIEDLSL